MFGWLKKLFVTPKPIELLDDHVEEEAPEKRLFPTEGLPYRTVLQFLDHKPATEEDLYEAECRIQEWLFQRMKDQDCTHVLGLREINVLPDAPATLMITAQRPMRIGRLVLFSPQLDQFQVENFNIGVESQGELYQGPVNASLYRILTLAPVQLGAIIMPGMSASVIVRNKGREPLAIGGALLGNIMIESLYDRASIIERVRARKRVIALTGDESEEE